MFLQSSVASLFYRGSSDFQLLELIHLGSQAILDPEPAPQSMNFSHVCIRSFTLLPYHLLNILTVTVYLTPRHICYRNISIIPILQKRKLKQREVK